MLPWLTTEPAPGTSVNLSLPARKSWFERFRLVATRPATSTCAPEPNTMPDGLMRNTRPFDCNAPRIWEGLPAATRVRTAEAGGCWMKRVTSLAPIEKLCQLMIELGLLVTWSRLPFWMTETWPLTTCAPVGLASAVLLTKQDATARETSLGRNPRKPWCVVAIVRS